MGLFVLREEVLPLRGGVLDLVVVAIGVRLSGGAFEGELPTVAFLGGALGLVGTERAGFDFPLEAK